MQRTLAIARLTLRSAFRSRLFYALALLLVGGVVLLPLVLKHDGTATGFAQIVITYTFGLTTVIMGFATLWFSCSSLARDIEECQIQTVAAKPVSRVQIWMGKWLGIMFFNVILLGLSSLCAFLLMTWRSHQLAPEQQKILREEVFVGRGSIKEPLVNLEPDIEKLYKDRMKELSTEGVNPKLVRKEAHDQILAAHQVAPPGFVRRWDLDFGGLAPELKDRSLWLRVKFQAAKETADGLHHGEWRIGPPGTPGVYRENSALTAGVFHELKAPPNLLDAHGRLTVEFVNRGESELLFPLSDGMEALYPESGFALNYARGVAIVGCWLALLAAIGLAAASFLSFPVASLFSLAVLVVGLSQGVMSAVVQEGSYSAVNEDLPAKTATVVDRVMVPVFKAALFMARGVISFSPVASLASGRSISWGELTAAFGQIVLLAGGAFAVAGMVLFERRELAAFQSGA